jgi:hypothetical protein
MLNCYSLWDVGDNTKKIPLIQPAQTHFILTDLFLFQVQTTMASEASESASASMPSWMLSKKLPSFMRPGQTDDSRYLMYAYTIHAPSFSKVIEALDRVIEEGNFMFTPAGIRFSDSDSTKTCFLTKEFPADRFEKFYCPCEWDAQSEGYIPIIAGINMKHMAQVLGDVASTSILGIHISKAAPQQIVFTSVDEESGRIDSSPMNMMELPDIQAFVFPDIRVSAVVTMDAGEFQKICRTFAKNRAQRIDITIDKRSLSFHGDFGWGSKTTELQDISAISVTSPATTAAAAAAVAPSASEPDEQQPIHTSLGAISRRIKEEEPTIGALDDDVNTIAWSHGDDDDLSSVLRHDDDLPTATPVVSSAAPTSVSDTPAAEPKKRGKRAAAAADGVAAAQPKRRKRKDAAAGESTATNSSQPNGTEGTTPKTGGRGAGANARNKSLLTTTHQTALDSSYQPTLVPHEEAQLLPARPVTYDLARITAFTRCVNFSKKVELASTSDGPLLMVYNGLLARVCAVILPMVTETNDLSF